MIQNGIDMFVYQGALAFEMWTGRTPNIERMKQLRKRLEANIYVNRKTKDFYVHRHII